MIRGLGLPEIAEFSEQITLVLISHVVRPLDNLIERSLPRQQIAGDLLGDFLPETEGS